MSDQNLTADKRMTISDMSDSEFLSFLYSERDRENSISEYHGWNNWALVGSIITIACFVYATVFNASAVDWLKVLHYAIGSVAFFLSYHTWLRLFKRERGYDFTIVRLLKEMTPWVEVSLSLVVSLAAIVLIAIYGCPSPAFWLWIAAFILQLSVGILAICNGNRLVPFFFYRAFFPNRHMNAIYDAVAGIVFCEAWLFSFRQASWHILSTEFEVGICFGSIVVLLYILVKINVENKVVKQFDAIIDMYVYSGVSKEETYQAILCNRMGYGVLDVCKKDLEEVQNFSRNCEPKMKELQDIKTIVDSGQYDFEQLTSATKRLEDILAFLRKGLVQSDRLSSRMDEIVKIAPVLNQVDALNMIFASNKELYNKAVSTQNEVGAVYELVQKEVDKYHCKRFGGLCGDMACEHRNEPMDKKYARRLRWRRFLMKLHLKNEE